MERAAREEWTREGRTWCVWWNVLSSRRCHFSAFFFIHAGLLAFLAECNTCSPFSQLRVAPTARPRRQPQAALRSLRTLENCTTQCHRADLIETDAGSVVELHPLDRMEEVVHGLGPFRRLARWCMDDMAPPRLCQARLVRRDGRLGQQNGQIRNDACHCGPAHCGAGVQRRMQH